jgi:hypothetical protein
MKRTTITLVFLLTSFIALLLDFAATLPSRVDELLLTNNELCRAGVGSVNFDDEERVDSRFRLRQVIELHKDIAELFYELTDLILWKLIVYQWGDQIASKQGNCKQSKPSIQQSESQNNSNDQCTWHKNEINQSSLHPICKHYREFRSNFGIRQIWIPWNWYYSCKLLLRGVSVRSLTSNEDQIVTVDDVDEEKSTSAWSVLSGGSWGLAYTSIHNIINSHSIQSDPSVMQLPPSLEIESLELDFKSWSKPVVSLDVRGVAVNVVIQKGRLVPLPLIKKVESDSPGGAAFQTKDNNGFSIMIGDMTIQEAVDRLPKPPEKEGMYPMIGLLNVSNVTVTVTERGSKEDQSTLNQVMRLEVPDALFAPVVNLTSGECGATRLKCHYLH